MSFFWDKTNILGIVHYPIDNITYLITRTSPLRINRYIHISSYPIYNHNINTAKLNNIYFSVYELEYKSFKKTFDKLILIIREKYMDNIHNENNPLIFRNFFDYIHYIKN